MTHLSEKYSSVRTIIPNVKGKHVPNLQPIVNMNQNKGKSSLLGPRLTEEHWKLSFSPSNRLINTGMASETEQVHVSCAMTSVGIGQMKYKNFLSNNDPHVFHPALNIFIDRKKTFKNQYALQLCNESPRKWEHIFRQHEVLLQMCRVVRVPGAKL